MSTTVLGDQYVTIGVGTSAQRPGSPVQGMLRYNTSLALTEIYDGSTWSPVAISSYNVLTVDSNGDLIHNQVVASDGNTSISQIDDALSAFFSSKLSLSIDGSGNLTATY